MKSKKVTMLAAALVVAVVAFAAVGYATVTQYTAKTTSTKDVAESAYITVNQGGTGAYDDDWLTKVYFDTTNTSDNVFEYSLVKEWRLDTSTNKYVQTEGTMTSALISGALALTVKGVNSTDRYLKIEVETTTLTAINGLKYNMVLSDVNPVSGGAITEVSRLANDDAPTSSTTAGVTTTKWTFDNVSTGNAVLDNTDGKTYYVLLFIEESGTVSDPSTGAGFGADNSFKFTVTADDDNGVIPTP